jgi:hypothetical protein
MLSVKPLSLSPLFFDKFRFDDVGKECIAIQSSKLCEYLINKAGANRTYLCICVPCYNEESCDIEKTITSLMENMVFMKNVVGFRFLLLYRFKKII